MKKGISNLFSSIIRQSSRLKIGTRILSLLLSVILIFYVIPSVVYAEIGNAFENTEESESIENAAPNEKEESNIYDYKGAAYEVLASREESVKHFHLEDGSYVAAQYNYPVHYLGENGAYLDIDNALSENSNGEFSNSNARIKFAKKITGNETLFTLHEDNTKITFSLIGANKGTVGVVTNNEDAESDTELQKMMNLEKLSSSVIYKDILEGVDLEYIAESLNIKENIIVKEKKDSYSYSFELKLNGLLATLTESGDIEITNEKTGELKYIIPAPVVYDASGVYAPSSAAFYTLSGSNKKYTLTVTVSPEWMNAEERVFPVTVDPAVTTSNSGVIDTYIDSASPTTTHNNMTLLRTRENQAYAYWKTTSLPNIPDFAYISNATLTFIKAQVEDESAEYLELYDVISYWDENLTWYNHTYESCFGRFQNPCSYDYGTGGIYAFNVTDIVRRWCSGGNNYGVAVGARDEEAFLASHECPNVTIEDNDGNDSNNESVPVKPVLYITYTDMKGIENYWSFSSQSAGVAGSGNVNLATGNLTLTVPLLSTTDSLMPFVPTLVYNSSLSDKPYTNQNAEISYTTPYMPHGFKLNICETIVKKNYTDINGEEHEYFVYADSDGTEHGFYPSETNPLLFVDEHGLQKTLDQVSEGVILITDDSKITRRFVMISKYSTIGVPGAFYLESIIDSNGNTLKFDFDNNFRPTQVSLIPNGLTKIPMLYFLYNSAGKIRVIHNPATKEALLLSYSNTCNGAINTSAGNYLKKIEYAYVTATTTENQWLNFVNNGTTCSSISLIDYAEYEYSKPENSETAYMTSVKESQSLNSLTYAWNQSGKVVGITEYSSNCIGQSISYLYENGYTDVLTSGNDEELNTEDDIVTRYSFDVYGRAKGIYSASKDGSEIYGATVGNYATQDAVKNSLKEQAVLGGSATNYIVNGDFEGYQSVYSKYPDVVGLHYWSTSGNVSLVENPAFEKEGSYGAGFYPSATTPASISQSVYLKSGTYTLSFLYEMDYADNVTGTVTISSATGMFSTITENISYMQNLNTYVVLNFSKTFEIPDNANGDKIQITISFSGSGSSHALQKIIVDRVMLENNVGASDFNLVAYGSFDESAYYGTDKLSLSTFWEKEVYTPTIVTDNNVKFGNVLKVYGDLQYDNHVCQRVFREIYSSSQTTADTDYIVTGFAKAPEAMHSSKSAFRIRVDVTYATNVVIGSRTVSHYFDFLVGCDDWQFTGGTFSTKYLPDGTFCSERVTSIDVYCEYSYQPGIAYFDNISVVNADDATYERYYFYDNGLVKRRETAYSNEYYEYNADRNITRVANDYGEIVDYTYPTTGNTDVATRVTNYTFKRTDSTETDYPFDTANPNSLITKTPKSRIHYTFDSYGLKTGEAIYSYSYSASDGYTLDTSSRLHYNYSYKVTDGSKIFGALLTVNDEKSTVTRYYYDENSGRLNAEINQTQGDGICYSYDELGRLIAVMPAKFKTISSYTEVSNAEKVEYTYNERNLLETLETESTVYTFTYDVFGNSSSIKAGDNTLTTYEYNTNNGKIKKINYGNDFSVEYVYNEVEFLKEVWYNEGNVRTLAYEYEYTADGQVQKFVNCEAGKTTVYHYDAQNKLVSFIEYDDEEDYNRFYSSVGYTEKGELNKLKFNIQFLNGSTLYKAPVDYAFYYHDDGKVRSAAASTAITNISMGYTYDSFDRITEKSYVSTYRPQDYFANYVSYTYKQNGVKTTGLVETYTSNLNGIETTYTYTYDANGNITKIVDGNGEEIRYVYDDLGQLIREDNGVQNYTNIFSYDDSGNITLFKFCTFTAEGSEPTYVIFSANYSYSNSSWGDLLTSYNGNSITYDALGNPTRYYDGTEFFWDGRLLVGAQGTNTYSFTYNDEGIRTSKTKNGVTTTYYLNGSQIIGEETNGNITLYIYDESGSPIGMQYHGANYSSSTWDVYWFEKNIFGDVVGVYNHQGTKLVSYAYEAYGYTYETFHNGGGNTTAKNNPFRYRSYYFDLDLKFYYLGTRYYDQETYRFISADTTAVLTATPDALTDKNLYAYCDNNPVMRVDRDGELWVTLTAMAIGGLIGSAISAVCSIATQKSLTGEVNWKSVGVSAITGFFSGVVAGSPLGIAGQQILGGVISGLSYIADCYVNDQAIKFDEAIMSIGMGVVSGRIGGVGANHNMALSNAAKSVKQTIAREARRANRKYAQKAISYAVGVRNSLYMNTVIVSSYKFAFGTCVSGFGNGFYNIMT